MHFEVETRNVDGQATTLGSAGRLRWLWIARPKAEAEGWGSMAGNCCTWRSQGASRTTSSGRRGQRVSNWTACG